MKPEEQRIAIAKACGWLGIEIDTGLMMRIPKGYPSDNAIINQKVELPDYLNDLNAMHEAEEVLHGEKWAEYFDLIQHTGKATGVRATAAQRAEAFLRTLGLWKEEA